MLFRSLSEQPNILELQRKTDFDKLKEILQNFLNPEDAVEVEEVEETTPANDLPWKDDEVAVKAAPKKESNYTLKTPAKASKADKFDALFEEEEN